MTTPPTQKTILIVEDEAPAIFALEKYLTNAGYKILRAFSAHEGLKQALDNHPDVMVLDLIMPMQNGLDILPELREDSWGASAKVIVFSNLSGDEYKARARKYNVDAYLVKTDTSLSELEKVISQLLPHHAD